MFMPLIPALGGMGRWTSVNTRPTCSTKGVPAQPGYTERNPVWKKKKKSNISHLQASLSQLLATNTVSVILEGTCPSHHPVLASGLSTNEATLRVLWNKVRAGTRL